MTHEIFGKIPRWLSVLGYILPVGVLLLIGIGCWGITIPIVISLPITLTRQTTAPDSPIIGVCEVSPQDARKIVLRQAVTVSFHPTPQSQRETAAGIVQSVRLVTPEAAAAPTDRRRYHRALFNAKRTAFSRGRSEASSYTVTIILPESTQPFSDSSNLQGIVRIEIGSQRLFSRLLEMVSPEQK